MPAPDTVECKVKFTAGAYNTNTVKGCRGSSTVSAQVAVGRLAMRLYGGKRFLITLLSERVDGTSVWRVRLDESYSDPLSALKDIEQALADHPDADRGNSKVHFALMRARAGLDGA